MCFKVLCFNENLHAECLIFALAPYLGVVLPASLPLPHSPSQKVATKMQSKVIFGQIALSFVVCEKLLECSLLFM